MQSKHQDLGHTIVGITATSDFITAPIFREFGITEILATNAEVADGKYTGKVAGLACYQKGKLARLEAWLDGRSVSESWAYSDSINDRFYLNMQRMRLQSTLMIVLRNWLKNTTGKFRTGRFNLKQELPRKM